MVLHYTKVISEMDIVNDPWVCLLHNIDKTLKQYKESLPHLLNAAKCAIQPIVRMQLTGLHQGKR